MAQMRLQRDTVGISQPFVGTQKYQIPIEDEQGNRGIFVNLAKLLELLVQLRFALPQGTFGQLAPRYVDDRESAFQQRLARYGLNLCKEKMIRPIRHLHFQRIFTLSLEYVVEECSERVAVFC